jgi:hypothetical protein
VDQTGTEQVAFMIDENLGFVFKPAECGGMNDAITVALEFTAPGRGFLLHTAAA